MKAERPLNAKLAKAPDDGLPYFCIETPLGQIVARCNNAWGEYFLKAVNQAELFAEMERALTRLLEVVPPSAIPFGEADKARAILLAVDAEKANDENQN